MIHREGYKILLYTVMVLLLMNAAAIYFGNQLVQVLAGVVSLFVLVAILQFFRNPARKTPVNDQHIIAPADGKVVVIEETLEDEYLNERRIQISIFMSPLNVHVNRNPVGGTVTYVKYHPGKYLVAWHPKSSTLNERTTLVIRNTNGIEVLFRQIAGAVARRIKYYIKQGDQVTQGQEMGFIRFGSRVDVFVPRGSAIKVNLDEKVTGGETILAELPS